MFLIHFDFVVMKLLLKKSGDAFAIIHFKQADYSLNESVSNLSVVRWITSHNQAWYTFTFSSQYQCYKCYIQPCSNYKSFYGLVLIKPTHVIQCFVTIIKSHSVVYSRHFTDLYLRDLWNCRFVHVDWQEKGDIVNSSCCIASLWIIKRQSPDWKDSLPFIESACFWPFRLLSIHSHPHTLEEWPLDPN